MSKKLRDTPSKKAKSPSQGRTQTKKPQVTVTRVFSPEVLPREEEPEESSENLDDEEPEDSDRDDEVDEEAAYKQDEKAISRHPVTIDFPESTSRAVSVGDPLRRYLEEVKRYPLLEPQEEMRLAIQLRNTGDLLAAKTLVSANLRLVVKIALEYKNFYSNLLDLVQEGNIGLMKAVSKFDPTKGAKLSYYASWWIRSYILKYLLDNFRLVKVGTTQAQKKLFYHLMREKERLEAQGLLAGPKLLAEKLHVREKDVLEMQQRLSGRGAEMSLDAPIDRDEGQTSHMELLVDEKEGSDERLARNQLLTLLHNRLPAFKKLLNDRELKILQERLLQEDPKTLQEVADQYGLTRERARQIEGKVVAKLREFLKDDLGPSWE